MYESCNKLKQLDTGDHKEDAYEEKIVSFDKYDISIKVGPNNEFMGIIKVIVNTDFLSYKQKLSQLEYRNSEEQYPPDEEYLD